MPDHQAFPAMFAVYIVAAIAILVVLALLFGKVLTWESKPNPFRPLGRIPRLRKGPRWSWGTPVQQDDVSLSLDVARNRDLIQAQAELRVLEAEARVMEADVRAIMGQERSPLIQPFRMRMPAALQEYPSRATWVVTSLPTGSTAPSLPTGTTSVNTVLPRTVPPPSPIPTPLPPPTPPQPQTWQERLVKDEDE